MEVKTGQIGVTDVYKNGPISPVLTFSHPSICAVVSEDAFSPAVFMVRLVC